MKKHLFMEVEFHSTVKLSAKEIKELKLWLSYASDVANRLIQEGVISLKNKSALKRVNISLLLAGDTRIKSLNYKFRNKNKTTDVLSFPAHENLRTENVDQLAMQESLFIGDLAISVPQTKRQARKFSISFLDEFIHLFFHGLLHLLGYDHELSKKEEVLMQKWESRTIELFSEIKKKGL